MFGSSSINRVLTMWRLGEYHIIRELGSVFGTSLTLRYQQTSRLAGYQLILKLFWRMGSLSGGSMTLREAGKSGVPARSHILRKLGSLSGKSMTLRQLGSLWKSSDFGG